ncbi:MAG: PilZ domain-containing protein [Planctomycetia bacterium]|nr:PilZ domain-containing protein [Planctomycetia bacterium]
MRMAAIPLWRWFWEPAPPLAQLVPETAPAEAVAEAERRDAQRHSCHREAWLHPVSLVKSLPWHAIVMDLSATGIGLAIERPVAIGTFFAVELPDPLLGTTRLLRARVVHATAQSHQYWHIGCELVPELPAQDLKSLL